MNTLAPLLTIIIPLLTAIVGWLFGRRKQNNDFLGELQTSINLLSDNYTKTLNELVLVKKQNTPESVSVVTEGTFTFTVYCEPYF